MSQRSALREEAKIIRREESSHWLEGSVYLEKAKKKLEEAEREAAEIREKAWQQAYRDGQLAGMKEVQSLIAETQAAIENFHRNLDRQVAEIALAISRKVVNSIDLSDAIASGAAEAVASFKADAALTLFVPPALYESIRAKMTQLQLAHPDANTQQLDVRADAGLSNSQGFLADGTSSVDLSIPAQFEVIEKSLRSELGEGRK